MANRGLQFEWAILYEAKNRLTAAERTPADNALMTLSKRNRGSSQEVLEAATKMIKVINDMATARERKKTWQSFVKVSGGGAEPKTDIMFKIGSKKYKCSMKFGKSIQLASGGLTSSIQYLTGVLNNLKEDRAITSAHAKSLIQIFAELDENYNVGTKAQPEMKRLMTQIRNEGGLQDKLQRALGSTKNPQPAEEFAAFKEAVVRESMTGQGTFGKRNDRTANYILSENKLIPITNSYIKKVAERASVRIRLKGRSSRNGVKFNEIVISIDSIIV